MRVLMSVLVGLVWLMESGVRAGGPSAMGSPQQLDWLSRQIGVMITYNMQTYSKAMSTGHVVPASDFAPNNVSIASEWLDSAAAFGAKYAVLTTDHFSGFNLWPSQAWADRGLSPYTVAGSSWHAGSVRDVVAEYAAECKARGIGAGVYYSVHNNWAFNVSNFVTQDPARQEAYNEFALAQLTELLDGSDYPDWYEMWFDAGVKDDINPGIGPLVRRLAPHAICHSCNGFVGNQGVRWVGNENAVAPLPNWYGVASGTVCAGQPDSGSPTGSVFCPPSCDTVIGLPSHHKWFWTEHTAADNKSPDDLVKEYLTSVGRGCNLILNIAPAPSGGVDPVDQPLYAAMGKSIAALTATELASRTPAPLSSGVRGYGPLPRSRAGRLQVPTDPVNLAVIVNISSSGVTASNLTVEVFESLADMGQRVAGHEVWLLASSSASEDGPEWMMMANSSTIGYKRVYVPGAADALTEGNGCDPCVADTAWPLELFAVGVRVTSVPSGFSPPSKLASVAVYVPGVSE